MNELDKLRNILKLNNIEFINKSLVGKNDGLDFDYNGEDVSVVSHPFSYGGYKGLLEILYSGKVEGWLRAEDILKILEDMVEKV